MNERGELLRVVHGWMKKAEHDLINAKHTLRLGKDCPTDTVSFHAQQCVEKYIKALLVYKEIQFPKTHNLPELVAVLPSSIKLKLSEEDQERLTDCASVTRYPGDYDEISITEAKRLVGIALRCRREARRYLSKFR